jgi:hypothetical protein
MEVWSFSAGHPAHIVVIARKGAVVEDESEHLLSIP